MVHISSKQQIWKYTQLCRIVPFIAAALYFLTAFVAPYLHESNELTTGMLIIQAGVVLSLTAIWFIAMQGALRLKNYARTIKTSTDGQGINLVANGLLMLVFYVIAVPNLINGARLLYETEWFPYAAVMSNFLPILLMTGSVTLLFIGSQHLCRIVAVSPWTWSRIQIVSSAFGLVGSIFLMYFVLTVPSVNENNTIPRFVLPLALLTITYALPQLIIWLVGCLAYLNIAHFAAYTPGRIYKAAFMKLNYGLLTVIACTFATQLLIISPVNRTGISLGALLTYILLIAATVGFIMINRGASELQKIEEVT